MLILMFVQTLKVHLSPLSLNKMSAVGTFERINMGWLKFTEGELMRNFNKILKNVKDRSSIKANLKGISIYRMVSG